MPRLIHNCSKKYVIYVKNVYRMNHVDVKAEKSLQSQTHVGVGASGQSYTQDTMDIREQRYLNI